MNTPAQCGAIKPPKTDIYSEAPRYAIPSSQSPETAQNQLDYAFASRGFHESIKVRAINGVEEWGASDHCRLLIEISG